MSYRITEIITAINAALNYPAITYDDVSVYLDMCVGEINTTLHTSLRTFREYLRLSHERRMSNSPLETLAHEPTGEYASVNVAEDASGLSDGHWNYYVGSDDPARFRKFVYVDSGGAAKAVSDFAYAVHVSEGVPSLYQAHAYSEGLVLWVKAADVDDIDVTEFLPEDWISLFVVPYVCFKYTVRDGGTASTFAEEMEQGFQQLQETYDVPNQVRLSDVASLPAYAKDVEDALKAGADPAYAACATRAIFAYMKHPRGVNAQFGSMYDAGGWGI